MNALELITEELIASSCYVRDRLIYNIKTRFFKQNPFQGVGLSIHPNPSHRIVERVLVYGFTKDKGVFIKDSQKFTRIFEYNTFQSSEISARELGECVEDLQERNCPIEMEARSFGGILARLAFLRGYLTNKNVRLLITRATPHQGIRKIFRYVPIVSCREMVEGSDLINELQTQVLPSGVNFVNYYNYFDEFIPKGNAIWPDKDGRVQNILIEEAVGHASLLSRQKKFELGIEEGSILS